MTIVHFAIVSGLLQALGYFVYVRMSLKHEIEPNPTTWFMFSYGTFILLVLESNLQASWTLLVLPVVCTVLAVVVAFICLKRGTLHWPKESIERFSLGTDVLLTVAYVSVWYASSEHLVSEEHRHLLLIAFLVLTNLSTIVEFTPLVRGAWKNPRAEHPLPWIIWAGAYATLGYVTYIESGWESEFMIYPAINTVLHGVVGIAALRRFARTTTPQSL